VLALVGRLKHASPTSRLIVLAGQVDGLLVRDLFACGVMAISSAATICALPIRPSAVLNNRPYLRQRQMPVSGVMRSRCALELTGSPRC
jgi:hypothetical protein